MSQTAVARLGTAFSETFPLSRAALGQVLVAMAKRDSETDQNRFDFLRQETQLGTNYVKAMPRYARGVGLLSESSALTALGEVILKYDPLLTRLETQWLLHYHLSAPLGPGPAFWHHLVVDQFKSGNEFTRDDVINLIDEFIQTSEGKSLSSSSIKGATAAFLGTYSNPQGLGELEILKNLDDISYRVLEPEAPSAWVVAYAVLDYWRAAFPDQITVSLSDFSGAEGVASLFLIGSGRLNAALREMQNEGYVEVHRLAPPYQVVLLNSDRDSVLERIYSYE